MRVNKFVLATLGIILCSSFSSVAASKSGFFNKAKEAVADPMGTLKKNEQIAHIARDILELPYILTVDSTSPAAIRAAAAANSLAVTSKNTYELFFNNSDHCLARRMIQDVTKVGVYTVASIYDVIRFLEASNIALQNLKEKNSGSLQGFKFNQLALWGIEVLLRFALHMSGDNNAKSKNSMSWQMLSGLADVVEMWRLLNRFNSYFSSSKIRADLKLIVNREEVDDDDDDSGSVHEYAQLTEDNLKAQDLFLEETLLDSK